MKYRDYKGPLLKLLDDTGAAESQLEVTDSQFIRRAYVRSLFAYIEGAVWLVKQTCLEVASASGFRARDPADYAILSDQSYELKDNGETMTQTKFLRLPANLRFALGRFNGLFGSKLDLGVGTTPWNNFLAVIDVRHRITHPKNTGEYDVTDSEIELAKNVCAWFNELMQGTLKVMAPPSDSDETNA